MDLTRLASPPDHADCRHPGWRPRRHAPISQAQWLCPADDVTLGSGRLFDKPVTSVVVFGLAQCLIRDGGHSYVEQIADLSI